MANKTELIRQRMAQTRESLRQRLDALEDRTLGVVKETTEAVQSVAETVEGTVESATKAVKKTVRKSVKMLDLGRHVEEHPWAAMSGAVASGFALSFLLSRSRGGSDDSEWRRQQFATQGYQPPQPQQRPETPQPPSQTEPSSIFSGLTQMLGPSLDSLKQLAIGTAIGVVKDMTLQSVPREWSGELGKVFNNLTENLGGTPVESPSGEYSQGQSQPPYTTERPRWEQEAGLPGETQQANEPQQQKSKKKPHGNGRHSESTTR
jgi:ElaB/YqjD/DUF883 family membrane-anchored ribosome-binding protein